MSMRLSDLSTEINLYIFSFLDDQELRESSLVCTTWRALINKEFYDRCQKYLFESGQELLTEFNERTDYKRKYTMVITAASNQEYYQKLQNLIEKHKKLVSQVRQGYDYPDTMQWPLSLSCNIEWDFNELNRSCNENVRYKSIYNVFITKRFDYKGTYWNALKCATKWVQEPMLKIINGEERNMETVAEAVSRALNPNLGRALFSLAIMDVFGRAEHASNGSGGENVVCRCISCNAEREVVLQNIATSEREFYNLQRISNMIELYNQDYEGWSD